MRHVGLGLSGEIVKEFRYYRRVDRLMSKDKVLRAQNEANHLEPRVICGNNFHAEAIGSNAVVVGILLSSA